LQYKNINTSKIHSYNTVRAVIKETGLY